MQREDHQSAVTRTQTKRQAIVDAATEVFYELGFERASMSEICRRVGGSKATIYHHFPSKNTLYAEVMHLSTAAEFLLLHRVLERKAENISEALQHFGERLLALLYSPSVMVTHRMLASCFGNGELGRTCFDRGAKRTRSEVAHFLRAAMKKGKLRPCDPLVATAHLRGLLESELLDSFVFQVHPSNDPEQIKGAVERAVAVFMSAYGPKLEID